MKHAALFLLAAAPMAQAHGIFPSVTATQRVCKKSFYTDFLSCAYETDYDSTTGKFADPSVCGEEEYADEFGQCRGGFWYLANYNEFGKFEGKESSPSAVAGGLDKLGNIFAYYQFPAAAEEPTKPNGEPPVHYMDCKVCNKFLKGLLAETLPLPINNVSRINAEFWQALTSKVGDDASSHFLAYTCSIALKLPQGEPWTPLQWAPLEVNAAGELDYVMINPSVVMDNFYQVCPSLEARVSGKTDKVVVRTLKGNINQNFFWPFKRYCPTCPEYTCGDICGAAAGLCNNCI